MGLFDRFKSDTVTTPKELTAKEWYDKGEELLVPDNSLSSNKALGHYEKALKYYDKALELDPQCAEAWASKGAIYSYTGHPQEALQCYEKALGLDAQKYVWVKKRGVLFRRLHEEVLQHYDKALEIDPQNALAWRNKGVALAGLRRYEEALPCFDKALEINPHDATVQKLEQQTIDAINEAYAWNKKAIAYIHPRVPDTDQMALEYYDKAIEVYPYYANAWKNKGMLLACRMGRYQEGIQCLDKALELDPRNAKIWASKGRALWKSEPNHEEEALQCFNKALEIDPGYEDAQEYKQAILKEKSQNHA